MVNPEELSICKRRGHDVVLMTQGKWSQCEACGMWLRQVIEEREDDPPAEDIDPLDRARRRK
jgi:hypothetical protein